MSEDEASSELETEPEHDWIGEDGYIAVAAENSTDCLQVRDGCVVLADEVPLGEGLRARIRLWARVFDDYGVYGVPLNPAAFDAEGLAIARAIKAEHPAWTVFYMEWFLTTVGRGATREQYFFEVTGGPTAPPPDWAPPAASPPMAHYDPRQPEPFAEDLPHGDEPPPTPALATASSDNEAMRKWYPVIEYRLKCDGRYVARVRSNEIAPSREQRVRIVGPEEIALSPALAARIRAWSAQQGRHDHVAIRHTPPAPDPEIVAIARAIQAEQPEWAVSWLAWVSRHTEEGIIWKKYFRYIEEPG